jgi:hypothetical protein
MVIEEENLLLKEWKTNKTKIIVFYQGSDKKSKKIIGRVIGYDSKFVFIKDDVLDLEIGILVNRISKLEKWKNDRHKE